MVVVDTEVDNMKLNEIKKGDYVSDYGDIGLVNKVKGQVAYVKFNLNSTSFQPVPIADLNKKGKHKGKDLYVLFEGKLNEAQPVFQKTPNEFAYLDFKKWAYSNRNAVKGILLKAMKESSDQGTALFLALRQVWLAWSTKKAKQWSKIPNKGPQGKDFGRALAVMMKKDNLIIARSTNKLTDIN